MKRYDFPTYDLHFTSTSFGVTCETIHHLNAQTFRRAKEEAQVIMDYNKGNNYKLYRNGELAAFL